MKFSTMIFSPTGGTMKVVNALTVGWGTAKNIDLSDGNTDFSAIRFDQDEAVVIAVPSFGGRVPALAIERLSAVHGNQVKAILVCVYGNRDYDDTLVELYDVAKGANFTVVAAVAAIAEHSIVHQYATNRPDKQDEATLAEFSQKILEKIQANATEAEITLPGNRPYKKSMGGGLVPKTGKNCNQCGLCAQKCPAGAIDLNNAKITDKSKCISCMRCVAICPKKARSVNALMVKIAAFALKKSCSTRKECELYL